MLVEAETGLFNIVWHHGGHCYDEEHSAHHVKTHHFYQPAQYSVYRQSCIDGSQRDDRDNIERKRLPTARKKRPVRQQQQRGHEMFAIPPAIHEVKGRSGKTGYNEERIILDPDSPAIREAALTLAAGRLSNEGTD